MELLIIKKKIIGGHQLFTTIQNLGFCHHLKETVFPFKLFFEKSKIIQIIKILAFGKKGKGFLARVMFTKIPLKNILPKHVPIHSSLYGLNF